MKLLSTLLLASCLLCAALPAALADSGKALGALTPDEALAYMQRTDNLVIVDVAARSWYARQHFAGAVSIPIEDISASEARRLYKALPAGRPVILHCRLGMIVPAAYEEVRALRPDIPELSYIAGKPPFEAFEAWQKDRSAGDAGGAR